MDDINSFTYVSISDMNKSYYGVEAGLKFKVTSAFDIKLIGQISDAKIMNDGKLEYMKSQDATVYGDVAEGLVEDHIYNKGMRESGTPLTAASLGLSYHSGGWFVDLNANYYDRIYLSYSPNYRYQTSCKVRGDILNNEPIRSNLAQAKGHGGFMIDGSIGRSIYLKHGSLSINLSVTNILNNTNIVTGGYEQSRSDYSTPKADGTATSRAYKFSKNPMKFYAYGTNGMLNIAYKF